MPSKITLPLHRFIKKFLKNIPAPCKFHSQLPSPPPQSPENQPVCPSEVSSKWTSKRIVPQRRLVAIQSKVRHDLHHSAVQCRAGTFKSKSCLRWPFLCLPENRGFSVENRAQLKQYCSTSKLMNEVTRCKYMTVIVAKLITTSKGSLALCTSMQASPRPKLQL